MRNVPIIPTILVVAAAGIMVALGVWQLGRADEKEAMIAEFERQSTHPEVVDIDWGTIDLVYRKVRLDCSDPEGWQAVAGRNDRGQSGLVHRYSCAFSTEFQDMHDSEVVTTYADIGWSTAPNEPDFEGAVVEGTLVALGDDFKVVASSPLAGLKPLAKPDPKDLPNNHLAYAGQWFFFALTALVIYGFALKSHARKRD